MRTFRIIFLSVMFPDLGVPLSRHCLCRVQIEKELGGVLGNTKGGQ